MKLEEVIILKKGKINPTEKNELINCYAVHNFKFRFGTTREKFLPLRRKEEDISRFYGRKRVLFLLGYFKFKIIGFSEKTNKHILRIAI